MMRGKAPDQTGCGFVWTSEILTGWRDKTPDSRGGLEASTQALWRVLRCIKMRNLTLLLFSFPPGPVFYLGNNPNIFPINMWGNIRHKGREGNWPQELNTWQGWIAGMKAAGFAPSCSPVPSLRDSPCSVFSILPSLSLPHSTFPSVSLVCLCPWSIVYISAALGKKKVIFFLLVFAIAFGKIFTIFSVLIRGKPLSTENITKYSY